MEDAIDLCIVQQSEKQGVRRIPTNTADLKPVPNDKSETQSEINNSNILVKVAQMVKNLPAVQETRVRSLGWEDPLEKEMATHSSTLAWKIPWTEEPGRLQSMGSQRGGHN